MNDTAKEDGTHYASTLYHREALIRYIMCCSQSSEGGFRDKPGK